MIIDLSQKMAIEMEKNVGSFTRPLRNKIDAAWSSLDYLSEEEKR